MLQLIFSRSCPGLIESAAIAPENLLRKNQLIFFVNQLSFREPIKNV